MKKFLCQNIKVNHFVVLGIILVLATARLIYLYNQRDGHHIDETWSYGFANSYFNPHLFGGYEENEWENIEQWVTGDVFKDYITVSGDQRFLFDSVMYNKANDLSPALYELILHFICSFFPDSFSWNYAFFINLICYIPVLVLIYLISKSFTESDFCGCLSVIYYVLSGCGTANFLYLRVYHLFTLFTLLLFWIMQRILKNEIKAKNVLFLLLVPVTLLGALTHYYYLVIAFLFTAFFSLCCLFQKRIFDFFRLCFFMLLSVFIFFVIYPQSLRKLLPFLNSNESVSAVQATTGYQPNPYAWDLSAANKHFFIGTIGFAIDFNIPDIIWFSGIFVFAIIVIFIFVFLFRNEKWMKELLENVKIACYELSDFAEKIIKQLNCSFWISLICVVANLLILPYSASLFSMGYIERYFFPTMSLFIVSFISLVGLTIHLVALKRKKIKILIISLIYITLGIMCSRSHAFSWQFEFRYMGEKALYNQLSGKDCFMITCSPRDLIWLSTVLYDSDDIYISMPKTLERQEVLVPKLDPGCLLLVATNVFLDEKQAEDYQNTGTFELTDMNYKPQIMMTVDDYVEAVNRLNRCNYEPVDEFATFVSVYRLYRQT